MLVNIFLCSNKQKLKCGDIKFFTREVIERLLNTPYTAEQKNTLMILFSENAHVSGTYHTKAHIQHAMRPCEGVLVQRTLRTPVVYGELAIFI